MSTNENLPLSTITINGNEIVTDPDLAALVGPVPFTDTEWTQAVETARAQLEREAAAERAFESRFA